MSLLLPAVVTLIYGAGMAGGGWAGYKVAKSVPSLAGGVGIGAVALVGGVLMFAGSETGRGLALFASSVALLFFGWRTSRSILTKMPAGRPAIILSASLMEVAVLLLTAPARV